MIEAYYRLAKPGIVYGNLLPAIAAFVFGSSGAIAWSSFAAMVVGLGLVIACGCVLNNYFDRDLDARMERTKRRPLVTGAIAPHSALIYAAIAGILGVGILWAGTTILALGAALAGLFVYVAFYTPLKRRSAAALYVGAVAGAMPPVVGYVAAAHAYNGYAAALFLALYAWQIPHFIAIAVFRFEEYRAAGVPLVVTAAPSPQAKRFARRVFGYSLWVLLLGCLGLMLHTWMR